MPNRFVSVGDDFTLPADVKAADANLPARLQDTALNATYALKSEVPPTTLDGGNATSTYDGSFNFDGGSAA
ncbi:hypothetical protein PP634_gp31 [Arthrobacter phage Richie]|uniref:Uncharacterized protein n=2 Tax=Caudoviricetes TaxID=2731619 RepID=A0A3G3M3J6_9CAUD|nr:hypothetical protein PP634_gp31 [Arthrobacter phage Richie]YP_010656120.1 hypothetical protein PP638_gp72 [Arthrobacter phage Isolde]UYL86588.1 hypothetical protein SEA_RADFAD_31 [Arthrobacter phage RadFad]WNM64518.1 hypothetical protein SEA_MIDNIGHTRAIN_31 [Arthrobacter phage MidnightRain]AYN58857.1 hypothetical protein PBI_RICHIE_31 [Arthrobacter phage Richie]AYR01000.1 hypothetical protein PBI_ISOLDE_31 [Arthrobacter phage Isolde]